MKQTIKVWVRHVSSWRPIKSQIKASIYGLFAVHRNCGVANSTWVVTHVALGRTVRRGFTREREAIRYAIALSKQSGWEVTTMSEFRKRKRELGALALGALREIM